MASVTVNRRKKNSVSSPLQNRRFIRVLLCKNIVQIQKSYQLWMASRRVDVIYEIGSYLLAVWHLGLHRHAVRLLGHPILLHRRLHAHSSTYNPQQSIAISDNWNNHCIKISSNILPQEQMVRATSTYLLRILPAGPSRPPETSRRASPPALAGWRWQGSEECLTC